MPVDCEMQRVTTRSCRPPLTLLPPNRLPCTPVIQEDLRFLALPPRRKTPTVCTLVIIKMFHGSIAPLRLIDAITPIPCGIDEFFQVGLVESKQFLFNTVPV